jgi:two-component system, NarL family, nitrate/nitrite response regulator NarL
MSTSRVRLALLVDDNDIDLFVQKRLIEINGFADQVITFRAPLDALSYLSTSKDLPEIIFLDLNMPVMDGFEFLERFLVLPHNVLSHCKVVVLTSSGSGADKDRAVSFQNVIGFVSKPLSIKGLDQVGHYFQNSSRSAAFNNVGNQN